MNAPNLSRRLATRIIEGLQGRGRIVVVRGGTSALIRAVDDSIAVFVAPIIDRFEGELTLLDDQQTRESLAQLATLVAHTLFSSEHLEDVFADRTIVEREVFDAALCVLEEHFIAERERVIHVELDLLGYVAATAGKLASEELVAAALEHAADYLDVKLSTYDAISRAAIFEPSGDNIPDLRLELEEAVADELAALVAQGVVHLPVIERIRPLVHQVTPTHRTKLLRVVDRAATHVLRCTGCSAHWEFPDDRSLRVCFTPLSEQDARDADAYITEFATEVDTILADAHAPLVPPRVSAEAPPAVATRHQDISDADEEEPPPVSGPAPVVKSKQARRAGVRADTSSRVSPKRASGKGATKRAEVVEAVPPLARKSPVAKRKVASKKVRGAKKS